MEKMLCFSALFLLFSCSKNVIKTSCILISYSGTINIIENGKSVDAQVGMKLLENDKIETSENSTCEINIGDTQTISIKPNSALLLKSLFKNETGSNINLKIISGRLFVKSEKIENGSTFEVETDSMTCGIRRTEFRLELQMMIQNS